MHNTVQRSPVSGCCDTTGAAVQSHEAKSHLETGCSGLESCMLHRSWPAHLFPRSPFSAESHSVHDATSLLYSSKCAKVGAWFY